MKHYEPSKRHAVIAMTSVAMTAITIGALVVLPAKLDSAGADPLAMAAAAAATIAPIDVAISETRIEVPETGIPKEHSALAARLSARRHRAGNVKNRVGAAQPLPNTPDRSFRVQDRAMATLVSAKEKP
jgi:hypothetical protein